MNLRRRLSLFVEKQFDRKFVHPQQVWFLFEDMHLRKLFDLLDVDCVFDVGANAGQYASKLRNIGFEGSIISYEPIPALAEKLKRDALNDPKWFIEEKALDSNAGRARFNITKSDQL